jgi:hypothetical protein
MINEQTLPPRMQKLRRDARGYPIPWFVAYLPDGTPEFRAADRAKFARALKEKLCWVCGDRLGIHVTFVAGPMCGINRTSAEPPSHYDCAKWSVENCPFLNNPKAVRREDELFSNADLRETAPGQAIVRNPGVAMLWVTRSFELFDDMRGGVLLQMGEPEKVEWYAHGRVATLEEVQEAIDSGLPNLEAIARTEKGALEILQRAAKRLERYLPKASVPA